MKEFTDFIKKPVTLFIDIETLPSEVMPNLRDIKVPKNYKSEEAILKYQIANQVKEWRKEALQSHRGVILCVGYAIDEEEVRILTADTEIDLLKQFDELISTFSSVHYVGHNVKFDLLFLFQRSLKYGLTNFINSLETKRYNENYTDTMELAGGGIEWNYKISLDNLAKLLGFESSKGEVTGANVFDYWKAGNLDMIYKYCLKDVALTRKIYNYITDLK